MSVAALRPDRGLVSVMGVAGACVAASAVALLGGTVAFGSNSGLTGAAARSGGKWARVPVTAREVISRDVGRDESRFAVTRAGTHLVANGVGISTLFGRNGAVVRSGSGLSLQLGLKAIGRGGSLTRVRSTTPVGTSNTVTYNQLGIRQWYANGPLGLEQGFVLRRRVGGIGELTLIVGRVPAGDDADVTPGGASLSISHASRLGSLDYSHLSVVDATGRPVAARIDLARGRILLRLRDDRARYPLRIDPIVDTGGASLMATGRTGTADLFGLRVAISQDGSTIAVGAPNTYVFGVGAVYVFTRPADGWQSATSQTATLNIGSTNGFGLSVAVSGNGGTIVVGAPTYGSTDGTAYVFDRPNGGWQDSSVPTAALTASDGAPNDELGSAVAISEDGRTIVTGAPAHASAGAVYVFTEPVTGWQSTSNQTAELTASDGAANDYFGQAVAVSGDGGVVVTGVPAHAYPRGAAYVFDKPVSGWQSTSTQTAELTPSAGQTDLGESVAISADGGTVAATGLQAAAVFTRPGSGTWQNATPTSELPQDDTLGSTVGAAVSGNGTVVLIGSLSNTASGAGRGQLFTEPSTGWQSEAPALELGGTDTPSSAPPTMGVAISGDGTIAVVGSNASIGGGPVFVYPIMASLFLPVIKSAPMISGTAVESDVLTASTGTWNISPTSFAYQWEDCDSTGANCHAIRGATGSTYSLADSDVGQRIAVEVTATNQWGTSAPAMSQATAAVPQSGPVGLEIDNGDYATDDPRVTVEAVWPPGTQSMLISNNGGFRTDTQTFSPAASIGWTLEQTGSDRLPKTVYIRFLGVGQDDINFTDDIILDETAPTVQSATVSGPSAAQASPARARKLKTYKLRLKARDKLVGVCEVATNQRRVGRGEALTSLRPCVERGLLKVSRTLRLKLRSRPRYVRVRNSAGDWSRWTTVK